MEEDDVRTVGQLTYLWIRKRRERSPRTHTPTNRLWRSARAARGSAPIRMQIAAASRFAARCALSDARVREVLNTVGSRAAVAPIGVS
jgi:hypothetical protein